MSMKDGRQIPLYERIKGLKLTLKLGETVIINQGEIVIQIIGAQGNRVRIGILSDPERFVIDRGTSSQEDGT